MISFLRSNLWLITTGLVICAITWLSLTPLPHLPMPSFQSIDKIQHLAAYSAAALPVALAGRKRWKWLILVIFAWSGVIELIQPSVNRYGEWLDLLANGIGLALGTALGRLARWPFTRRRAAAARG